MIRIRMSDQPSPYSASAAVQTGLPAHREPLSRRRRMIRVCRCRTRCRPFRYGAACIGRSQSLLEGPHEADPLYSALASAIVAAVESDSRQPGLWRDQTIRAGIRIGRRAQA